MRGKREVIAQGFLLLFSLYMHLAHPWLGQRMVTARKVGALASVPSC